MIQGFSSGLIGNRELIYETDLPSFQRDFASVKTLDHGTGPAITFTRASGATYFDVNGVLQTAVNDVARFDHDPATGASRGLLIEEARTNNVQRSAEFDNAYWGKTNGSISANATTAPDGATSADKLVEDSTASVSHLVARNVAGVAPTQQLTGSCFIKADTRTFARIVVWDSSAAGNNVGATFDVSGGTVVSATTQNSGNATGASASITNVGNGWYRCSVSGIPNTSGSDSGLAIYLMSSGGGVGSTAYTGDGTSGLYI